ncbi:MAG: cytochrome C [Paracoccaceae bacterium]|nr:cytochrome C [Paracoccaceae bacterium]
MSKVLIAGAVSVLMAAPAFAEGHADVDAGMEAFSQCQTCHIVQDDEGNLLAGRNARQGPNLYNIVGRQAGSVEGFRYRPDLVAAGEAGLVWTEEDLVVYLQDPNQFLSDTLDKRARSGMAYRVRTEEEAVNLAAFLASVSPDAEGM